MDEVAAAFASACDALEPLQSASSLLLGCSAGGDSMALLDLAAREASGRGWKLTVAHLDHAQRSQSAAEVQFVEARCRELELPLIAERLRAPDGAGSPLTENAMREERYAFFHRAAGQANAGALVLAHQADDRAETFLMRLLAGSGPTGLSSIRPLERLDGLTVARPLLAVRRSRLRQYLEERGLKWLDDPSNEDSKGKRTWVRHRLLPFMNDRMDLDVVPRIVRASELAQEESGALDQACEEILDRLVQPGEPPSAGRLSIGHELWKSARAPLRRRLLRQWLWKLRSSPHPPGFSAVGEALGFAERAAEGAELRTVERLHLVKRDGWLIAFPTEVGPEARARSSRGKSEG